MKKFIIGLLVLSMTALMVGCGATSGTPNTEDNNDSISSAVNDLQDYDADNQDYDDTESDDNGENDADSDEDADTDNDSENSEADGDSSSDVDGENFASVAGTWVPYSAYDAQSDEKASLKTVFGADFNFGGSITLEKDGSFESNLTGNQSGSYTLADDTLTLTYDNGETAEMTLTDESDKITLEQTVVTDSGEYKVYYSM